MDLLTPKVSLTMVDDSTGEAFARSELKATDIPETLDIDTVMHLGDQDWAVVEATPRTRREYAKTKELVLRLRRVEMVDPGELLYSLPTIADELPTTDGPAVLDGDLFLHEDDWRQVEFVSAANIDAAAAEIAAIQAIVESAREGPGFKSIHVRKDLPVPLVGTNIEIKTLMDAAGTDSGNSGVSFSGCASQIMDGFAIRLEADYWVYGLAPQGVVSVLGVQYGKDDRPDALASVAAFAVETDLYAIDWCGRAIRGPDVLRKMAGLPESTT